MITDNVNQQVKTRIESAGQNQHIMVCLLAEALHEAGCDDGTPRVSAGVVEVAFERQAHCLEEALRGAIADVQKAGCRAAWVRIEPEDLALAAPAEPPARR